MTSHKERTQFLLIDRMFDFLETLLKVGFPSWAIVAIVQSVAGQETVVNVAINYFSQGGNLFPWSLAGATSLWAYGERKFRLKKVAYMSRHLAEAERRMDPNRSSSGLTSSGQTPSRSKQGGIDD